MNKVVFMVLAATVAALSMAACTVGPGVAGASPSPATSASPASSGSGN